jgi:hypothetical protein
MLSEPMGIIPRCSLGWRTEWLMAPTLPAPPRTFGGTPGVLSQLCQRGDRSWPVM